ncbi:hypothetical protein BX600DRAFT_507485 [Xylariales sp. PMI_506]|nr:hypothetical protein BX600DRAFT_507485 [Xylariales sp. PMI_506]
MTNSSQDHDKINPPTGSEFTSLKILPDNSEEIGLFQTIGLSKRNISHAFIAIHGKLRDGGNYWNIFEQAVRNATNAGYPGASFNNQIVVAPEFFSQRYNSGQYTKNQLAWDDINSWQAMERAIHPAGTRFTSMDVIDSLITGFSDKNEYPNLTNITVVGHGGGGQLVQRYAAFSAITPSNIHIRYIHGDPSSCVYFTKDRPTSTSDDIDIPAKSSCKEYDKWRYGFDGFSNDKTKPETYFKQYADRDVISIVGLQDTDDDGDQTCMARVQGGKNRRDRNLIWYRYINTLAQTREDLEGFPGDFDNLTDWGSSVNNTIKVRLIVVENATHDAAEVFQSNLGRASLFNDGDVPVGWRPTEGK